MSILGGSMIVGINPIPIARVQETLDNFFVNNTKRPVLKKAELGDNGGLWGGITLLRQKVSDGNVRPKQLER